MLIIEKVRKLLPEEDKNLSDEEITKIIDDCRWLAELAIESYFENKRMKTLKFRHDFVKEIIEGRKTTTWRLFDDKDLKTGDRLSLVDSQTGEVFAKAVIIDTQTKTIENLTDDELKNHGYNNRDDMITSHKGYYGDKVDLDTGVKIVEFKVIN